MGDIILKSLLGLVHKLNGLIKPKMKIIGKQMQKVLALETIKILFLILKQSFLIME